MALRPLQGCPGLFLEWSAGSCQERAPHLGKQKDLAAAARMAEWEREGLGQLGRTRICELPQGLKGQHRRQPGSSRKDTE